MSCAEQVDEVCASCGIKEVDDVKLKKCVCKLVQYCSVDCEEGHRSQHEETCKKRVAEMRDVLLFTQPEMSHLGECPICCLPLPLDETKSGSYFCCFKRICIGCSYANQKSELQQGRKPKCPFCRMPAPERLTSKFKKNAMKRAKANDPAAMVELGTMCYHQGDYAAAFRYWTQAAELGDALAHYELALLYRNGEGVERDFEKEMHHVEEAAIGGHPTARNNLATRERMFGRTERAMKHFIICAKLGYDSQWVMNSPLEAVKQGFTAGIVSKEDYAAALRGYQAAKDATKSKQREEVDMFLSNEFLAATK